MVPPAAQTMNISLGGGPEFIRRCYQLVGSFAGGFQPLQKCENPSLETSEVALYITAGANDCMAVPGVALYVVVGIPLGGFHSTAPQSQGPTSIRNYNGSLGGLPVL